MPLNGTNLFGLSQFDNRTSYFTEGETALTQAEGWTVLLAFGAFFALVTALLVWIDARFGGTRYNSEDFNTAGRAIKTGLTAVDVIAKWGWVSDILQSGYEAYTVGITGAYWYAAGAVTQILLFGVTAVEVKQRAPTAHTFLELVRKRWGNWANIVFMYMGLLNNVFVTSVNLIGAAINLSAATGVNVYASLMLIPLGIIIYTTMGGLKATFTSSYIHTVVLYVVLCIFMFEVYASDKLPVGSIQKVYDNVMQRSQATPVKGNKDGEYLTFWSRDGVEFGIVTIIGSFGNVWADQSYWQSAIAASPRAACRGYILGGILWFAIPLCFSTSIGMAALAADLPISDDEAASGLVPVAVGHFLMGKAGVWLILAVVFMAVTSACSAEFIAVSSIFTYDIYKAYIRPRAEGEELLLVSRVGVIVFGLFLGAISCIFYALGININFLFLVVGILVASAVPPLVSMLMWPAVSSGAAIAGAIVGQVAAIIAWMVHTQTVYGEITVDNTQEVGPTMTGNLTALLVSAAVMTLWTLFSPDLTGSYGRFKEPIETLDGVVVKDTQADFPDGMKQEYKLAILISCVLSFIFTFAWPLLSLPAGVFSLEYFGFFIVLSMIWGTVSTIVCTLLPIWQSRHLVLKAITCGVHEGSDDMRDNNYSGYKSDKEVQGGGLKAEPTTDAVFAISHDDFNARRASFDEVA